MNRVVKAVRGLHDVAFDAVVVLPSWYSVTCPALVMSLIYVDAELEESSRRDG